MSTKRSLRRWALASTGIVAAAMLLVQGTSLAASPTASPTYYKAVSNCATAKKGFASCFAMHLVQVRSTSKGARLRPQSNPGYSVGPSGGFTPADLAKAYGVNPAAATSMTVAIVDAHDNPHALTDLNFFDHQYGLPNETATSFKKLNQAGNAAPLPSADAGWAGEIALDIEAVRGLCNNCKIRLYEANTSSFSDLGAAVNKAVAQGANIVSNSYGGVESAAASAAYDHPGTVIVASTGDHGMFDWDHINDSSANSANKPSSPASFNTVVAVGGTTLYLNQDATRSAETVWNENGSSDVAGLNLHYALGATGGGCSTVTSAKSFQSSVAKYAETTCGTKRMTGDVAALADPYTGFDIRLTYPSGTWSTYGGTSLAAPLISAMWALAGGSGGTAYPAANLYKHFAASNHATMLYDVTAGGNGFCDGTPYGACQNVAGGPPNTFGVGIIDCAWKGQTATLATGRRECDAATGYDGPSGVGTPRGVNAFKP